VAKWLSLGHTSWLWFVLEMPGLTADFLSVVVLNENYLFRYSEPPGNDKGHG